MKTARVLHCLGDEAAFAAERLPQRLENLGRNLSHEMVGISPDQWRAEADASARTKPAFPGAFTALSGRPTPGRLLGLANAIKPYDLVLTYGYGAADVALAHTLFSEALGLPPLIHHETVLTGEERRLSKRRKWYRRIALGRASGLVVPSERLEEIALVEWQQPIGRVKRFAPGVNVASLTPAPKADALTGVIKRAGERWIGARLENTAQVAQFSALIEAFSYLPDPWHLVVMAAGIDTDPLSAAAEERHVAHRLHLPKPPQDISAIMGLFEVWTAMATTPLAQRDALIAMAAARPVLAQAGSDIAALLAPPNAECLAKDTSASGLQSALWALIDGEDPVEAIGHSNREQASQLHDEKRALDRYRRLYASALGLEIKP